MKKLYILISVLFFAVGTAQNYTFVNTTAPYTNLTGATSLSNGEIWDDPEYALTLPFPMTINGVTTSTFTVFDSYLLAGDGSSTVEVISPLSADLVDRGSDGETSLSPISYKIDGVAGNRIAKIEFNNAGAWSDAALTMYVNFQIWMYESTSVIEYRFGPSSVPNTDMFYGGESGGIIGLTTIDPLSGELSNTLLLVGNADTPTTTTEVGFITGTPSNGRVFKFTPTFLNVDSFAESHIQIYPNPAAELLKITGQQDAASYKIFDTTGKLLSSGRLTATEQTINVSHLATGLYFLQVDSAAAIKFLKL